MVLGVLVDVFLVVGDDRLGDSLSDGVDLGSVAAAGDADADVNIGELVEADDQEGFVDLDVERSVRSGMFGRVVKKCFIP